MLLPITNWSLFYACNFFGNYNLDWKLEPNKCKSGIQQVKPKTFSIKFTVYLTTTNLLPLSLTICDTHIYTRTSTFVIMLPVITSSHFHNRILRHFLGFLALSSYLPMSSTAAATEKKDIMLSCDSGEGGNPVKNIQRSGR